MHSSTGIQLSHSHRSAGIALWMMLCLLFAQWLGLTHAIAHAGLKSEPQPSQISTATSFSPTAQTGWISGAVDHQKSLSACAALDAATLGAGLHSAPLLPLLLTLGSAQADAGVISLWQQAFTAFFSSRAPPSFH